MKRYLAIDIGASGGRHILGWLENGRFCLKEMYRFENKADTVDGRLIWDVDDLFEHILAGMRACASAGLPPDSMGVDTWGVDYVLLDADGARLDDAVAYRDSRTQDMDKAVEQIVSYKALYARTGIQKLSYNTIYQLMAVKQGQPGLLEKAHSLLMLPDYFHFLLTGQKRQEYTNATTAALVNAQTRTWDDELIEMLGYPRGLFGPLSAPGTPVGWLLPEIQAEAGFNCQVVLPATHDTGSAFMAVPCKNADSVFLSSGTWSLLGLETAQPLLTDVARQNGFSNEGGYNNTTRFLKNIMGLWIIQSIRREDGKRHSYAQLEEMARESARFTSVVNAEDDAFFAPQSMITALRDACAATGQPVPQTLGEVMQCAYLSLAACYAKSIGQLQEICGRRFKTLHIVGGGSKDSYLNGLTATACGLPVYAGPGEGTVIGNLMAQMLAAGDLPDLKTARAAVADSFSVQTVLPE